jgi:hypothetical protein
MAGRRAGGRIGGARRRASEFRSMSDEAFLHADDPSRLVYDRFKDRFDREDRVLVALVTRRWA